MRAMIWKKFQEFIYQKRKGHFVGRGRTGYDEMPREQNNGRMCAVYIVYSGWLAYLTLDMMG